MVLARNMRKVHSTGDGGIEGGTVCYLANNEGRVVAIFGNVLVVELECVLEVLAMMFCIKGCGEVVVTIVTVALTITVTAVVVDGLERCACEEAALIADALRLPPSKMVVMGTPKEQ